MTSSTAIQLVRVAKRFSRHTGQALLRSHVSSWLGRKREWFHALRNISFCVERGESLAVIGTNGAGKSTLLSLVAGLAQPDAGVVFVNGRIAPLLELGAGFHRDLTGAENVRMNASLLGLSRSETERMFEGIVDFAGVRDFIDEPLRTYSSGMMLRLAFSVAINVDPDILIIDEVLAVGDQAFQAKCFEKILEHKRAGKTLVFVSHVSAVTLTLCERALWLDAGELIMDGAAQEVFDAYAGRLALRAESQATG